MQILHSELALSVWIFLVLVPTMGTAPIWVVAFLGILKASFSFSDKEWVVKKVFWPSKSLISNGDVLISLLIEGIIWVIVLVVIDVT